MEVVEASPAHHAGFLGAGFMTEVHSRASRAARGILRGVASSGLESARRSAARDGIGHVYDSSAELFADELVDVVHVCTPNSSHASLAMAAIEAGKNVICEKPLATTSTDAERLVRAARERGVVATVPFVYRYHPMVREARARVAAGDIGRLLSIHGSYLQDWLLTEDDDNWRVDEALGGPSRAFADIGSHLCDLIEFVTDDRVARVSAITSTAFANRAKNHNVTTEDLAGVVIQTGGGAIGTLLVSQVAPGRKNRLAFELSGSNESIFFDQEEPERLWLGRRVGSQSVLRDPGALRPDAERLSILPAGHPLGYQDAFNAFVADTYAAIDGEQPDGLPTFDDGLRAVQITEAVLASASSNSWIDVPPPLTHA